MTPGEQTGKRSNYSLSAWKWCKGRKKNQQQHQHALVFCTKNVTFKSVAHGRWAHWAHTATPQSVFQPPTGRTLVSLVSCVNLESFISCLPAFHTGFHSDTTGWGNGSLPMCLKPNLFWPKALCKLDDHVARRFTQGFKSLQALGDAQLPTKARKTQYELLRFFLRASSLVFGFCFTQAQKEKHLKKWFVHIITLLQ